MYLLTVNELGANTEGIIYNFTMSSYRGGEWSFINLGSRKLFVEFPASRRSLDFQRLFAPGSVRFFFRFFFSQSSLGVSIFYKTEKFSERLSLTFTHFDHASRK